MSLYVINNVGMLINFEGKYFHDSHSLFLESLQDIFIEAVISIWL